MSVLTTTQIKRDRLLHSIVSQGKKKNINSFILLLSMADQDW